MAEEKTQLNREHRSELHEHHLCYIISQGFHLSDEQEYRALIENAEYKCEHCGRVAKNGINLCTPTHL
jgi:hypothetical protein